MARVKKQDAKAATDDVPVAEQREKAAIEKKSRKANGWNLYYKENHAKFKSMEEHKAKSHTELTKAIAAEYKTKKTAQSAPAAAESTSTQDE